MLHPDKANLTDVLKGRASDFLEACKDPSQRVAGAEHEQITVWVALYDESIQDYAEQNVLLQEEVKSNIVKRDQALEAAAAGRGESYLRQIRDKLTAHNHDLEATLEKITPLAVEAEKKERELLEVIKEYQDDREKLGGEVNKYRTSAESANKKYEAAERARRDLTAKLGEANGNVLEKERQLGSVCKGYESTIVSLRKDLEGKVDSSVLEERQQKITELEKRLSTLQSASEELKGLKKSYAEIETEKKRVDAALTEANQRYEQAVHSHEQYQAQVLQGAKDQAATEDGAQSKLTILQAEYAKIQSDQEKLSNELEAAAGKNTELDVLVETARNEITDLTSSSDETKNLYEAAQAETTRLQEQLSTETAAKDAAASTNPGYRLNREQIARFIELSYGWQLKEAYTSHDTGKLATALDQVLTDASGDPDKDRVYQLLGEEILQHASPKHEARRTELSFSLPQQLYQPSDAERRGTLVYRIVENNGERLSTAFDDYDEKELATDLVKVMQKTPDLGQLEAKATEVVKKHGSINDNRAADALAADVSKAIVSLNNGGMIF
jgi:myosin heavy subunit